jgi:hypothetical protein
MRLNWIFLILLLQSCQSLQKSLSHEQTGGVYRVKTGNAAPERVYLDFSGDTITRYTLVNGPDQQKVPGPATAQTLLPGETGRIHITKTSADIDLTTILFKYRPAAGELPAQLNTNFNFAIYSGYRQDYYTYNTFRDPFQRVQQEQRHWGWDVGLLAGMGTSPINPWVTRQHVEAEYDGLILQTGIAAYAGFNNLAAGLCLGFDYLTDANRKHWIYHKKPWIGLAIGMAIN